MQSPLRPLVLLLLSAPWLLLVSCGERPVTTPADGDIPMDGGLEGGLDSGLKNVQGLIFLIEIRDDPTGAQQAAAYAFFSPRPLPFFQKNKDLGSGCATYPPDAEGKVQYSAGDIEISGGQYPTVLKPEKPVKPNDWLYPAMLNPELFSATTTIKVKAQGDELPAFSATMKGVGDLPVTFPPPPARRAAPLTVKFKASSGKVWVNLIGKSGSNTSGNVRCFGPASTGKFVVPAAALSALPASATSVVLAAGLYNEKIIEPAPTVKVHIMAVHHATRTLTLLP